MDLTQVHTLELGGRVVLPGHRALHQARRPVADVARQFRLRQRFHPPGLADEIGRCGDVGHGIDERAVEVEEDAAGCG